MIIVIFIIIIIFYYGYGNFNNRKDNLSWRKYTDYYYTIEYPESWNVRERKSKLDFVVNNSIPFVKDKVKFSIDIINKNSSREDFNNLITKYLQKNGLEKTSKSVKKVAINNQVSYRIIKNSEKEKIINFYSYKKGLVINLKLNSNTNNYSQDLEIANRMIDSFKFSKEGYKTITDIFEKEWNKYSLGEIEVYYPDNSQIYDNVEEWTKKRVEAFNYITDYLKTNWSYEPIKMYVFNNDIHGRKYGLRLGFASVTSRKIFTNYDQTPGHELTHIISCNMNDLEFIHSFLIIEGLATHLNMTEVDSHKRASMLLQRSIFEVDLLGNDFKKTKHAYYYGASFVRFLIDKYGADLFKEFFNQNKYSESKSFEHYYGKSGEELLSEWKSYLKENYFKDNIWYRIIDIIR